MKIDLPQGSLGRLWQYEDRGGLDVWQYHHHPELELNFVVAGTAVYLLGDRRYTLTEGTLVWLFPGQSHVLTQRSPDLEMWIAVFHPDLLQGCCRTHDSAILRDPNPVGHFCRHLLTTSARALAALFQDIASAHSRTDRFNAGLAYALLTAWGMYLEASQAPFTADVHPAVQRAVALMRHGGEEATVEEVAGEAGLSVSRLSCVFKQETGMTLVEFRNRQRLENFLRLYGRGHDRNMLDTALEAGFGSYVQFYRVFRQVMGCSPGAYRRHL